jgi:Icc-related predicted phosphoesterase
MDGERVGCEDLLLRLKDLFCLKLHVFGHVHESYGEEVRGGVRFVNASICTPRYDPWNLPFEVEV